MANPEHLRILEQGVEAWNRWREVNGGEVPDLDHANLRKMDLKHVNLSKANLYKAELAEASLHAADLTSADLSDADLVLSVLNDTDATDANFNGANLSWADLLRVNFRGARFSVTNLLRADFTDAILKHSNLTGANFTGAKLKGADFTAARVGTTAFAEVDLSLVKGLATVEHQGPSTIGIDTLFLSKGRIPESFLRGCGVPEEIIRYWPAFLNKPVQFYSCFISYSHEDKAFARLLQDRFQRQGIRCWLDEHQLLPGDDLHEGIDRGIRLWDKVLLCCSHASLKKSWWVDGEINRAFQKEVQIMKERGKKPLALIPLNLDGFLFSADYQSGKKAEITSRVAANFVGWEKDQAVFDRELEKVIRALRRDEDGREKAPATKL